jgi:hypothetical protein
MTSSGTSTDRGPAGRDLGIQPWHFFLLLALGGATWAVMVARDTRPAALIFISVASIAAGLVGLALHHALAGFLGPAEREEIAPLSERTREALEQEKALVLRSLKELEFDRAMRKVSDADFAEIGGRLRARAIALIADLDRSAAVPASAAAAAVPVAAAAGPSSGFCGSCGAPHDADARFCKHCGSKL